MGQSLRPIVRWPGGKSWIASELAEVLQRELTGTYFEPFVGGASVFLAMETDSAVLSDSNSQLIEFYQTSIEEPTKVIACARRHGNNEADYYLVRKSKPRTKVTRAGRFLYLNKTCWGGIFRLNRRGEFNVPYGEPGRIICRSREVERTAKAMQKAVLMCCDFESVIASAKKGDVVFSDPPYTAKGQFNGFIRYNESLFSWEDQIRLSLVARQARSRGAFVAVCGSYHRDVLSLYEGWWVAITPRKSRVSGSLASRSTVFECVLFSRKPKKPTFRVARVTKSLISGVPYSE